jgi:hypothetical protein
MTTSSSFSSTSSSPSQISSRTAPPGTSRRSTPTALEDRYLDVFARYSPDVLDQPAEPALVQILRNVAGIRLADRPPGTLDGRPRQLRRR